MYKRSLVLLALVSIVACSGQSATVPTLARHAAANEQYMTLGAQAALGNLGDSIQVTAVSGRAAGEMVPYEFPGDVSVYRHHTKNNRDLVEFHGKTGATFLELGNIRKVERRSRYGVTSDINLASLPMWSSRSPRCILIPQSAPRGNLQPSDCGGSDPGLCTDCSGPLAPGGDIACHYSSSCGGDPTTGTGRGTGIFRLLDPQLSCYFSFVDGSYSCETDGISNTDSRAPNDYSLGYEYNYTLHAAVLHCAGPTANTEVLAAGKTPDRAINLGFARIPAGSSKAWIMPTVYTFNTSITAIYFEFSFPDPLNGECTGSN